MSDHECQWRDEVYERRLETHTKDARIAELEAENARLARLRSEAEKAAAAGYKAAVEADAEIDDLREKLAASEKLVGELAGLLTTLMDTGIDPGMYLVDGITTALAKVPR